MKKFFFVVLLMLASTAMVSAQSFEKGSNIGSIHVGFGGSYGIPISLSYERGITNLKSDNMAIGVGGLLGVGFESEKYQYGKYKYSHVLIGARGAWHYTGVKKLDLYAGLVLGYNIESAKFTYNAPESSKYGTPSASGSSLILGIYAGARYYFNERFGVNAEIGYGLAYLNLGMSYKF